MKSKLMKISINRHSRLFGCGSTAQIRLEGVPSTRLRIWGSGVRISPGAPAILQYKGILVQDLRNQLFGVAVEISVE